MYIYMETDPPQVIVYICTHYCCCVFCYIFVCHGNGDDGGITINRIALCYAVLIFEH